MAQPRGLTTVDENGLWDALTNHDCYTIKDLAAVAGWTAYKASRVVKALRRLASEGQSWWTVAHVTRKVGRPKLLVVDVQTGQSLKATDQRGVVRGEIESLQSIRQQTMNGAAVFKMLAAQVDPAMQKRCLQQSRLMETVGDMAERVIDDLKAQLTTP